jgi:hypothetical protein
MTAIMPLPGQLSCLAEEKYRDPNTIEADEKRLSCRSDYYCDVRGIGLLTGSFASWALTLAGVLMFATSAFFLRLQVKTRR